MITQNLILTLWLCRAKLWWAGQHQSPFAALCFPSAHRWLSFELKGHGCCWGKELQMAMENKNRRFLRPWADSWVVGGWNVMNYEISTHCFSLRFNTSVQNLPSVVYPWAMIDPSSLMTPSSPSFSWLIWLVSRSFVLRVLGMSLVYVIWVENEAFGLRSWFGTETHIYTAMHGQNYHPNR